MRRSIFIIGTAALALAGAGCFDSQGPGGSEPTITAAPTASTTTTATKAAKAATSYGPRYLAIINPLVREIGTLESNVNPTPADLHRVAGDLNQGVASLRSVQWPGRAQQDVLTLMQALQSLADGLTADNGTKILSATTTVTADSDLVRSDLGLPPQ